VDGDAAITFAERPFDLHAGDMIIMPAHQPHALKAYPGSRSADDDPLLSGHLPQGVEELEGPAASAKTGV